ncbi:MAG: hypothetical protein ACRES7_11030 [Gammaproteobacteria bacterium]
MNEEFSEFVQKQREMLISSYEQSKSYANIIIFGGYAGLFAVWNFTRDNLEKWQSLAVGLLAITSITIFVVFELISLWLRSNQIKNLIEQLGQAKELERFPEEYNKSEMERAVKFMAVWQYFFFGAVLTGIGAAAILIYSFICNLI